MRKILFAATIAASVCALPAMAQVYPQTTTPSAHANATASGSQIGSQASTNTSETASGTSQPLGLGGLLQQAQAAAANPGADAATDGRVGSVDAKARARKARTQGH